MEHLGPRIARLAKIRYGTQRGLAEAVGVSPATVRNWARNYSHPSLHMIVRVADALGLTVDQLLRQDPLRLEIRISSTEEI